MIFRPWARIVLPVSLTSTMASTRPSAALASDFDFDFDFEEVDDTELDEDVDLEGVAEELDQEGSENLDISEEHELVEQEPLEAKGDVEEELDEFDLDEDED